MSLHTLRFGSRIGLSRRTRPARRLRAEGLEQRNLLSVVPGDVDLDGLVTGADFTIWSDHFGEENAALTDGDINGDSLVTGADFSIWADHFGEQVASNLTITPGLSNGAPDRFEISRVGDHLEVTLNGQPFFRPYLGHLDRLTISGTNDADTLLVDLAGGDLGIPLGLQFVGGGGIDALEFLGTPGNDALHVSADAVWLGSTTVDYEVESLGIEGAAGNDTLMVSGALSLPIDFDGGLGYDTLDLEGGSFQSIMYVAHGPSSGTIERDGTMISYDGIEPINDVTVAATFTFTATAAGEVIEIDDGPVFSTFQTTQVRSTTATFELVNFANKSAVTVDGAGGGDTFSLLASLVTPGLTMLTLDGSTDASTFSITRTRLGTATIVTGSAADDVFSVEGANLAGALTLDGAGETAGDNVTVTGTAAVEVFSVTGAVVQIAGAQTTTLVDIESLSLNANGGTDVLTVNGTAAADAFTLTATVVTLAGNPPINYLGFTTLLLEGLASDDAFTVTGTGATSNINAGAGNDTITVTGPITAALNVDGQGQTTGDTLNINGTAGNDTFTLGGNSTTVGAGAAVAYANMEDLNLNALGGTGDMLNVAGTLLADNFVLTRTTVTRVGSTPADYVTFETLTIDGMAGADTFDIQSTAAGVASSVLGSGNDDTVTVAGDELDGALTVNGGADADLLTVNGTAAADTITVTSTTVTVNAGQPTTYSAIETLTVNALAGIDVIAVNSTVAGTATTVNGDADNDAITVAGAALLGPLTVNGGANSDTLTVNGTAAADTITITSTTVTVNAGQPTTYSLIETLIVNGLAGVDTIGVNSTAAGTTTTINGDAGNDVITVAGGALLGPLTVNGGADSDALTINGTAGNDTFQLNGNTTTVGAAAAVAYSGIEDLNLDGLGGTGDVLNVVGTLAVDSFVLTRTTVTRVGSTPADYANFETLAIDGLAGNDVFDVQSTAAGVASSVLGSGNDDTFTVAGDELDGPLTVSGGAESDTLTVNGTAGNDTITVTGTTVIVNGNSATTYSQIETLTVNALSGTDTITVFLTSAGVVTNVNGGSGDDVVTVAGSAVDGPLTVNGGTENDTLTVNASSGPDTITVTATTVTVNANQATTYGTIEFLMVNGLAGSDALSVASTASGVTTTVDGGTGRDSFTVQGDDLDGPLSVKGGNDDDTLTVNGTTAPDTIVVTATSVTVNSNSATTYSTVAFVVVNGLGGSDTVTVSSTASITATTVNGGTEDDVIDVTGTGAGALTVINGEGGNDRITVAGISVGGPLSIDGGANTDTLTINGTAGNDTFTLNGNSTVVASAAPTSYVNIEDLNLDAGGGTGDALNVLGTSGNDSFALTRTTVTRIGSTPADYANFESLEINALASDDTFDVQSTALGVANSLMGGFGVDTFTVQGDELDGPLSVNGGNDNDLLTINASALADAITVTATTVTVNTNQATTYSAIGRLIVNGLAGNDAFDVQGTASGVDTSIDGGGGDDNVDVNGPGVLGPLTVDGSLVNDRIKVTGTSGIDTFALTATTITLAGLPPITYTATETVVVCGLDGNDVFNVDNTPTAVDVTLDAGAGNDEFNLRGTGAGSTTRALGGADDEIVRIASLAPNLNGGTGLLDGNLAGIGGTIIVDAGSGTANRLFVSDQSASGGNAGVVVTATQVTGMAGPTDASVINYTATGGSFSELELVGGSLVADSFDLHSPNAATVNLFTLGGNDTVLLRSTSATSATMIDTGADDDSVRIGSLPAPVTANQILGPLNVLGGAAVGDRLEVDDSGETVLTPATFNATSVTGMSPLPINYSQIEAVDLLFGSPDDELTIDFAGGTLPNILARMGAGNDDVRVLSPPIGALVGPVVGTAPNCLTQAVNLGNRVQVDGQADGPSGDDRLIVEGRDAVNDTISVGSFGSLDSLQVQDVEILRLFGRGGNDTMNNFTAACAFFEGGLGNDRMFGGSGIDVMFGGDGREVMCGFGGSDFLLPDHNSDRSFAIVGDEIADGGLGVDRVFAIGTGPLPDSVANAEFIAGNSFDLDIITWLYGVLLSTSTNDILDQALAQSCSIP